MLQEDSNGEASFEIIDRKLNESPKSFGKSESFSSLSSAISTSSTNATSTGNLFSNVSPPTTLPDFTLWQGGQTVKSSLAGPPSNTTSVPSTIMPPSVRKAMSQPRSIVPPANMPMNSAFPPTTSLPSVPVSQMPPMPPMSISQPPPISSQIPVTNFSQPPFPENTALNMIQNAPAQQPQQQSFINVQPDYPQFPSSQFSAAIPPSANFQRTPSLSNYGDDYSPLTGSGIRNWLYNMRDAVNSSGIISKVVEKTKSSVDTIITTLDPQMSEVIYSGGDLEFVVVSQNEEEVASIREAVHTIFGKAWINGITLNLPDAQEYALDLKTAVDKGVWKVNESLNFKKSPTVAIQNILLQVNDSWFEQAVLVLKDPERNITVQNFTQTIPIPNSFLTRISQIPEYTGMDRSKALSLYLNKLGANWQQPILGISRRDILTLTAKTLVKFYKNHL